MNRPGNSAPADFLPGLSGVWPRGGRSGILLNDVNVYDRLALDGERIVYQSDGSGVDEQDAFEIYVMKLDSLSVTRFTRNDSWDGRPVWSPDGRRMAFETERDRNLLSRMLRNAHEIHVMNSDGSDARALTRDYNRPNRSPSWSPSGLRIAHESGNHPQHEIYVVFADGSEAVRLTDTGGENAGPSWGPSTR